MNEELTIGQRVLIVGDHPWAGHVGEIVAGLRRPASFLELMYTVRLEDGHEGMAKPKELKVLE